MKECSETTLAMDEGLNATPMATLISVTSSTEKQTERESTHGQMESFTMESGVEGSSTEAACGKEFMVTPTLANGLSRKQRGMEFMYGETEIGMRENGSSASSMAKGLTSLRTGMCMWETTSRENHRERASTLGSTVRSLWGSSRMDSRADLENGADIKTTPQTGMKGSMKTIKRTEKGLFSGRVGTYTKEATKTMNEKGSAR